LRPLLRLPLFAKLLVANGTIVIGAAAAARWVSPAVSGQASFSFAVIALLGLLGILAGNASILWIALSPLRQLQQVAAQVSAGDLDARVPETTLADRETRTLIQTFNGGLAAAARQRQRLRGVQLRERIAIEAERERVAYTLHDGIAQALTALRIRLRLAMSAPDSQLRDGMLAEVNEGIGEAVHELRRVARGLRPVGLELLGLAVAIESYTKPAAEAAGLVALIRSEDVQGLLAPATELALYRIAQESLANVIRHAGADQISIALKHEGDEISLVIEDDGRGFDPAETGAGGLGLLDMQEHVAAVGGRFRIDSERGKGTRIQVFIPIQGKVHVR
jgi:signal transduction histidine kinase